MNGYRLAENISLAGRNTFHVNARAELMADVSDTNALGELLSQPWAQFCPLLVLGEGSNLLLAGDVPGLTLSISAANIGIVDDDGDTAVVRADAGVAWNDLVTWTLGAGLMGLENLALIPGTVGACPIQNIGAYGVEVGEYIEAVEAYDRETQRSKRLEKDLCGFAYRDSIFKRESGHWIIYAVEFRLPRQGQLKIDYAGVREELALLGIDTPRAVHVAEAISRIRTRKLPNPALIGNAGSFFKNPMASIALVDQLKIEYPDIPQFPGIDQNTRKLSAAWLIDTAGWKGFRDGDAGVSEQHALVLVNHGTATGQQLLNLARRVAESVQQRFGVTLEPEPRIIGATFSEKTEAAELINSP